MGKIPYFEQSDAILVAQAKTRDADAYGELYRRYVDSIYRYLLARLGNPQDAEDLTEEVFLRAFKALDDYRERGKPFSAFLYQAAKNRLADLFRGQKPVANLSEFESIAAAIRLPDKRGVQGDLLRSLRHAIDQLPPNYREVVILRVILALPTPTVAKWINLSEGVTLVLLWRALELVQRELQGSYAQ